MKNDEMPRRLYDAKKINDRIHREIRSLLRVGNELSIILKPGGMM